MQSTHARLLHRVSMETHAKASISDMKARFAIK